MEALEAEASTLQRWGSRPPNAAADWLRRQLKEQCADQPREPGKASLVDLPRIKVSGRTPLTLRTQEA